MQQYMQNRSVDRSRSRRRVLETRRTRCDGETLLRSEEISGPVVTEGTTADAGTIAAASLYLRDAQKSMHRPGCLREPLRQILRSIGSSPCLKHGAQHIPLRPAFFGGRMYSGGTAAAVRDESHAEESSIGESSISHVVLDGAGGRYGSPDGSAGVVVDGSGGRGRAREGGALGASALQNNDAVVISSAAREGKDSHGQAPSPGNSQMPWAVLRHLNPAMKKEALFRNMKKHVQSKLLRRQTMRARHIERHGYLEANLPAVFDEILRLLERASVAGSDMHSKRKEVVRLPRAVRVSFRGTPSHSILEIMQRTGSHAQVVHFSEDHPVNIDLNSSNESLLGRRGQPRGFNALTLLGTPAENDAALKLLPEMVVPLHAGRSLSEELEIGEYEIDVANHTSTDSNHTQTEAPEWRSDLGQTSSDPALEASDEARMFDAIRQWREAGQESIESAPGRQQQSKLQTAHTVEQSVVRPVWHTGGQDPRALWDARLGSRRDSTGSTIEELKPFKSPRSDIDSATEFTNYVVVLTSSTPRLLRRRITEFWVARDSEPQIKTTFEQEISSELLSLFNDQRLEHFVNREAVSCALQFGMRTSNYNLVHQLFSAVEKNPFYETSHTIFNIMLAAAAKREDLHNFRQVLRVMIKRDIRPSWRTWVCLHDLSWRIMNRDQALRTTQRLQRHGVFRTPVALRNAACSIVEKDLTFYLQRYPGFSLTKYLTRCDRLWGAAHTEVRLSSGSRFAAVPRVWLSTSVANRMINVLLLRGMLPEAIQALRTLEASGESPDTVTLNTFLSFHQRSNNIAGAVTIMREIATFKQQATARPTITFDESTYAILFSLAWDRRYFNVARVVWRYACCAGEVTWQMERRMLGSMSSYVPALPSVAVRQMHAAKEEEARLNPLRGSDALRARPSGDSPTDRMTRAQVFFGWVAKFATGVADGLQDLPDTSSITPRDREVLHLSAQPRNAKLVRADSSADLAHIDHSSNDSAESIALIRHEVRRERLREMVKADLEETLSLKPEISFPEMLHVAFEQDEKWRESGLGTVHPSKNPDLAAQIAEADDDGRTRLLAGIFEQMLKKGVRVPVQIGDARSPPRAGYLSDGPSEPTGRVAEIVSVLRGH